MSIQNKPAFNTWDRSNLDKMVNELWDQNKQLREAVEQLRLDNRDLSKQLRECLRKDHDDWK